MGARDAAELRHALELLDEQEARVRERCFAFLAREQKRPPKKGWQVSGTRKERGATQGRSAACQCLDTF